MIRVIALAALLPMLGGCAVPAVLATPAGIALMSAGFGALAAGFRLDQVVVCGLVSAEGIKEAQSVSAVCQLPAATGVPVASVVAP